MTPCCTDILKEVPCPQPGEGPIWFSCAYGSCHGGVGHVLLMANDGSVLYDGDPTGGTSKKIYIQFNAATLNSLGGSMEVTYKPGDKAWGSHICSRATFNWGYYGSDTVVGTAYLDNSGGTNDKGGLGYQRLNTFAIPAGSVSVLPVSSTSAQRTVCYEVIPSCGPCANQQPTGIWTPAASTQCGTFTQFDYGTDPLCPPYSRVVVGSLCTQTIAAFTPISSKTTGTAPFTVTAPQATSGLPVTLSVKSGPASISGNTVTLTGQTGTVVIAANQPGNANYSPAPEVTTSFTISPLFAVYKVGGLGRNSQNVLTCVGCGPIFIGYITSSSGEGNSVVVTCGPVGIYNSIEAVGVDRNGNVVCYKNALSNTTTISYADCIGGGFSNTTDFCGYNFPFPSF